MPRNQTITIPGKVHIKTDLYYLCYICSKPVIGKEMKPHKMGQGIAWVCKDCAEGLGTEE